ncbi:hypothetical protein CHS0354_015726 [Potamilus streckersoni]|uniref:Uncharacterized protein n=1 Tax=Potamilus streckersoni TaxID=2493646 RepID=A0AAE0WEJ3_9BIVA|nr:hypothetical protein CHS0354_015726 [Potamilus streckersoni]
MMQADSFAYWHCCIDRIVLLVQKGQDAASPLVFDPGFYLNTNPDLLKAGINTPEAARSHWLNNGIQEGRQGCGSFHSRQYLARYTDLTNAFHTNYVAAVQHYLQLGHAEGRLGYVEHYETRWTISNAKDIFISASARMGAAIDSLVWNNKEFINAGDHGRELQMACNTDYFVECYNPTEAGGRDDGIEITTKTIIQNVKASGQTLQSQAMIVRHKETALRKNAVKPTAFASCFCSRTSWNPANLSALKRPVEVLSSWHSKVAANPIRYDQVNSFVEIQRTHLSKSRETIPRDRSGNRQTIHPMARVTKPQDYNLIHVRAKEIFQSPPCRNSSLQVFQDKQRRILPAIFHIELARFFSARDDLPSLPSRFKLGLPFNTIGTRVLPAFWLRPGTRVTQDESGGCHTGSPALNTKETYDFTFQKVVTIGCAGHPNCIEFVSKFTIGGNWPNGFNYIQMEAPTGYLTGEFTKVYNYNSNSRQVEGHNSDQVPIVMATADDKYAMGVYAPPGQDTDAYQYYGVSFFPEIRDFPGKTSKWNVVFRKGKPQNTRTFTYKTYICVGDLNIVKDCLGKVIQAHPHV